MTQAHAIIINDVKSDVTVETTKKNDYVIYECNDTKFSTFILQNKNLK